MSKINLTDYDYDEDLECGGFVKMKSKGTKKKFKGHQSKHNKVDKYEIYERDDYEAPVYSQPHLIDRIPIVGDTRVQENLIRKEVTNSMNKYKSTVAPVVNTDGTTNSNKPHEFGPNTHEIKGVKIDFDGVADMQLVDNEKDGHMTYGIKFIFKGKKGFSRTVWFNLNQRLRDKLYADEYTFWVSLRSLNNEKNTI